MDQTRQYRISCTSLPAVSAVLMAILAFVLAAAALQPAHAQTFTVLHAFTGINGDGDQSLAGVVLDSAGNLYGTTWLGGDLNCEGGIGCGIVFKISSTGHETVLYTFTGVTGQGRLPLGGVIRDAAGNLYGTTLSGGNPNDCPSPLSGCGTVYQISTRGRETVLYRFTGTNGDGALPQAGLLRDAAGNLYGTTYRGGTLNCPPPFGCGTVFKVNQQRKESVVYSFTNKHGDGTLPLSDVVLDTAGNLYGTTSNGGDLSCKPPAGCGTVFKISSNGSKTVLHTFRGKRDGEIPIGGLIQDSAGNLYGTTQGEFKCTFSGTPCGNAFKITKSGKFIVLHNFTGANGEGANPGGDLVQDPQGNLYGTTEAGGISGCGNDSLGCGTIFKLDKHNRLTVLYSFKGGADGAVPTGHLARDSAGNLYGTNSIAGNFVCEQGGGCGLVYKLKP